MQNLETLVKAGRARDNRQAFNTLGLPIRFMNWQNSFMSTAQERQAKREEARAKRLAAQLRAHLQKRKTQVRARRAGEEDERSGLPAAKPGAGPVENG